MTNKHGIPIVQPPPKRPDCINRATGAPKRAFPNAFVAERFIAESIKPPDRPKYRVYPCGGGNKLHYHLTTKAKT